ncbi:hypothetical protein KY285_005086 [Solanum tuberosum]|nr:hypothetical protein KY289_005594 [Solanum tuberosum]KAH0751938.1 hypothetical protein KY285_005086 [Solanum tuberosum]
MDTHPRPKKGEKRMNTHPRPKKGEKRMDTYPRPKKGEKRMDTYPHPKKGEKRMDTHPLLKKGEKRMDMHPRPKKGRCIIQGEIRWGNTMTIEGEYRHIPGYWEWTENILGSSQERYEATPPREEKKFAHPKSTHNPSGDLLDITRWSHDEERMFSGLGALVDVARPIPIVHLEGSGEVCQNKVLNTGMPSPLGVKVPRKRKIKSQLPSVAPKRKTPTQAAYVSKRLLKDDIIPPVVESCDNASSTSRTITVPLNKGNNIVTPQ